MRTTYARTLTLTLGVTLISFSLCAQNSVRLQYNNSSLYSGIEVGSKGVKMSLLEVGKNSKNSGTFNVLKDTSVNTDFISFSSPTFQATLSGLCNLYAVASKEYSIESDRIFTVISSGVQMQAQKEQKHDWIYRLID